MQAPHKRLFLAATALTACSLSFAQQSNKTKPPISRVPVRSSLDQWTWTEEKWTGDSRPFALIRRSIDNAISRGAKPAPLALKYEATARQKRRDPQAQFRWAYAVYKNFVAVSRVANPKLDDSRRLYAASLALDVYPASSPHSYEYTRLRFLIEVQRRPARELKPLGYRLVQHNPQDNEVMYHFGGVLDQDLRDPEDRRQALRMAQELVRRAPQNANYQAGLAGTYLSLWQTTKNEADAAKAITGYRKYLQLAPPNARFRKRAQWWINYIQKNQ